MEKGGVALRVLGQEGHHPDDFPIAESRDFRDV